MAPSTHTLAVFGATGPTGTALVTRALAAGHRVRALVRDASRLEQCLREAAPPTLRGLEVLVGDVTSLGDTARAIAGSTAVLCALGAPAGSAATVRAAGTRIIVEAMERAGVERLVAVSMLGVAESEALLPFLVRRVVVPWRLADVVADHTAQEALLRRSAVSWTAVRAPALVHRDGGPVVHGFTSLDGLTGQLSHGELATFMLEELDARAYVRASPAIARRAVPTVASDVGRALPGAVISAGISAALGGLLPVPAGVTEAALASGMTGFMAALVSTSMALLGARRAELGVRSRPPGR